MVKCGTPPIGTAIVWVDSQARDRKRSDRPDRRSRCGAVHPRKSRGLGSPKREEKVAREVSTEVDRIHTRMNDHDDFTAGLPEQR